MDVSKGEKIRLGAFLLGTGAFLAVVLFLMVGKKIFTKKVPYYTKLVESVSGLELGTPVKQNGVEVGNISAINTDSADISKSVVHFEVAAGTPMKADMVATMGSYGITGLKYLEITGGSYSAPDVPRGGEVKSELSTLGKITLRADSIAYKIDRLLGNVISFTESQNREQLERLVRSSANLSSSLDSLATDINRVKPGKRMDNILGSMEVASSTLKTKIQRMEVEQTVHEYRKAAEGMTGVAQKVDLTVLRVQEDLAQSMSNLKETMKNMNTFSRQIKENPSVLLRGEEKQERHK
ncbi:MAG: Mammalian cell entry related domain protein [Fibrobacteres bacterium]|nr:Mammalian cell entry related domain protein [Fibrobacterota bacterium]